ncbi:MAG: hypothetical protein IJZ55_03330 [Lachnospiraceae bacterium]|nr:hypothetical protein [Lachnospiraceae bacterium]
MKKKCLVLTFILGFLFGTVACGKDEVIFKENNAIFTESFYEEVTEIVYWVGDTKHSIKNAEGGEAFGLFSSLELTEISMDEEQEVLYGFTRVDFVTENELYKVYVHPEYISVNSVYYSVDKDIMDGIRELALGKLER